MRAHHRHTLSVALLTWLLCAPWELEGPKAAGEEVTVHRKDAPWQLENGVLSVTLDLQGAYPLLEEVASLKDGSVFPAKNIPLFSAESYDGSAWRPLAIAKRGVPREVAIPAKSSALRLEDRFPGHRVEQEFVVSSSGDIATWWLELREGAHYVAMGVTLSAAWANKPTRVVFFRGQLPGARLAGSVSGSPIVCGEWFLGCEHPMATNEVAGEQVLAAVNVRKVPARNELTYTFAVGKTSPGQLRRDFQWYVERRRARPYGLFVNYNSWWDIADGSKQMTEAECLAVIERFGEELTRRRDVRMDSFVFDDGWDDPRTLWGFHEGFPKGFAPLTAKAREYQSAVGTWLSPFGGYGEAKQKRLAYGREQGYEVADYGFSLAGEKYFARFREICREMVVRYDVNFFKFDGIAGNNASGAGEKLAADVEALLRLCEDLRETRPDIYLSITTGTWPSPYWLWFGDSVWRNGDDCGIAGRGAPRQRWITYRDGTVKRMIIDRAPLYPLNSLMTIPVCFARRGLVARLGVDGLSSPDEADLQDEMWMGFASGTQLAELYVTPEFLSRVSWDHLAECIRWARANQSTLADVHWVGGNPLEGEIYGYAAWGNGQGTLILRNPSPQVREILLQPREVWELPRDMKGLISLRCRYARRVTLEPLMLSLDKPWRVVLPPWGIILWEASFTPPQPSGSQSP
ncbi:hypothetical protein [Thermogutta sp.]|uniref:hypothetical protein n=1 Tax=Thermogutta sp. TaxID=1962930 RepID=UPI0032203139